MKKKKKKKKKSKNNGKEATKKRLVIHHIPQRNAPGLGLKQKHSGGMAWFQRSGGLWGPKLGLQTKEDENAEQPLIEVTLLRRSRKAMHLCSVLGVHLKLVHIDGVVGSTVNLSTSNNWAVCWLHGMHMYAEEFIRCPCFALLEG